MVEASSFHFCVSLFIYSIIVLNNYVFMFNVVQVIGVPPPPNKTDILTTYRIVIKLYTYQYIVNATSHFEFQVDISILATMSEELATVRKRKIGPH